MDLETLNKEYVQFKSDLETAKKEIEALDKRANDLADDKTIQKGKLVEAKRNGDTVGEQAAEAEIQKIDGEIKVVQDDTIKKKDEMELLQAKINVRIREVKENPEMKKHLDEVMAKKYDRKVSELEHKKEEALNKKDKLLSIKQLATEHPSLENNLKGMFIAQKNIIDLKKELEDMTMQVNSGVVQYNDPVRAQEIMTTLLPQAESKLTANKTPLISYITKNGLNITEQDIDELVNNGYAVDGKGNIDLNATMNKNISKTNREIKGYDKSIRNHQIALDNIDREIQPQQQQQQTQQPTQSEPIEPTPIEPTSTQTYEKPKWFQFIQRFKNWNERRKQQALPEQQTSEPSTPPEPQLTELTEPTETFEPAQSKPSNEKNEFRDSLKYEIIQDVVKQMQTEDLKEAKKERKAEENER